MDDELSTLLDHICCYEESEVNAIFAEERRRVAEKAWDEGMREGKRLGEWGLPGLPNPYRKKGWFHP